MLLFVNIITYIRNPLKCAGPGSARFNSAHGRHNIMRIFLIISMLIVSFPGNMKAVVNDSLPVYQDKAPALNRLIPGIAGITAASFLLDDPVNNFFKNNQKAFFKSAAGFTDIGGEKTIVVPALLLTYGSARFLFKNETLQSASLNAIQSVMVTAIATEGIKHMAGRARPFTGEGTYVFHPFPGSLDRFKSLPSGHASLAFALFTPYAETYSRWIYLVPASVAIGRVYQEKHWVSDVFAGGAIGLVSGMLFTYKENIQIIPNGLRIYF